MALEEANVELDLLARNVCVERAATEIVNAAFDANSVLGDDGILIGVAVVIATGENFFGRLEVGNKYYIFDPTLNEIRKPVRGEISQMVAAQLVKLIETSHRKHLSEE